ncbi:YALIA101S08e04764g1_1 [Yarrowia lipolytica]|nr:Putative MFS-type transporter [Yarrowia lipolytica]SEI35828.1 YALIA101S08e04764g1_1 [Yarrowia lipolytica]
MDPYEFPPGTIFLDPERLDSGKNDIILEPKPSADPNEPLNWNKYRKGINFFVVCFFTLLAFALNCIPTVFWGPLNEELGFTFDQLNNGYAMGLAGLGLGCPFLIPFANKFGKRPVYLCGIAAVVGTAIWQAKMYHPYDMYIATFIDGLAASLTETIIQMTVADLFFVHQRGTMNGIFMTVVDIGNFLVLVPGGYITDSLGWRWVFWIIAIIDGAFLVFSFFFFEETKYLPEQTMITYKDVEVNEEDDKPRVEKSADAPLSTATRYLHEDRLRENLEDSRISMSQSRPVSQAPSRRNSLSHSRPVSQSTSRRNSMDIKEAVSEHEIVVGDSNTPSVADNIVYHPRPLKKRLALWTYSPGSWKNFFKKMYTPFIVLFTFPIVSFVAINYAFMLTWLAMAATSIANSFSSEPYNMSSTAIGNVNIAPFIGMALGAVYGGYLNDKSILWLTKRNGGLYEPEMRLYSMYLGAVAVTVGVFMFGIPIAEGKHWMIPTVGFSLIMFGFGSVGSISITYMLDCYKDMVADAFVGVVVVRNAFGTIVCFSLEPWINRCGLKTVFIISGCISVIPLLLIYPMIRYGKELRRRSADRYKYFAELTWE